MFVSRPLIVIFLVYFLQTVVSRPRTSTTSSTIPSTQKNVTPPPSVSGRNNSTVRNQTNSNDRSKPIQESGGYDAKLVEMINTAIVDRSPSVKWEDVGKKLQFPSWCELNLLMLFSTDDYNFNFVISFCSRSREGKAISSRNGYSANKKERSLHWSSETS